MVVTPDTIVTGVDPYDISEAKFYEILMQAGSPATSTAGDAYMLLGTMPVSIAFCLAVFHHESQYGKAGITPKYDTKNPGNCRSSRTGVGTVITTERGSFVKYPSWPEGWRDLAWRLVDPTYVYAKEGRTTIREIITRFAPASDGNSPESYIAAVVKDMNAWLTGGAPVPGTPYDHIIPGMIDARSQLATATQNQGGVPRGPYETIPLSAKRGVVVHYRGVVTDVNAGIASFKADATYHVGKNWARAGQPPVLGSGIMYHIGIDGQGNVYLLRDLNRVLWHCGAWPQNENTLAIQLPIGGNQRATNVQLQALNRVVDDWLAFTKAPGSEVWGHQELSPTDCPGTLMNDFVKPYRNAPPTPASQFFPETGFSVGGGFLQFWLSQGGLAIFGYPITDEFVEKGHTVQYFERARFEHHPGTSPDLWDVLLGRVGAELIGYDE